VSWQEEHQPRLSKAILTVGIGFVVLLASWTFSHSGMFWTAFGVGIIIVLIGIGECYLLACDNIRRNMDTKISMIRALTDADGEVRNAIGVWWPEFSFVFTDEPVITWQNTDVPYTVFQQFMDDSNEQYISPERNWPDGEKRRQWAKVKNKLVELQLVLPDDPAGPKSWLWRVNGYKHAHNRWMRYRVTVVDALQEME